MDPELLALLRRIELVLRNCANVHESSAARLRLKELRNFMQKHGIKFNVTDGG
jgi:hypothetical protein